MNKLNKFINKTTKEKTRLNKFKVKIIFKKQENFLENLIPIKTHFEYNFSTIQKETPS